MSSTAINRAGSGLAGGVGVGELGGAQSQEQSQLMRSHLTEREEAVSLPQPLPDGPLKRFSEKLGAGLTSDNPVFRIHSEPRILDLQKTLLETALKLPEERRHKLMPALNLLQKEAEARRRLQQMEITDEDLRNSTRGGKQNETA